MPDHQETRPSLVLRLRNARDEAAWGEFLMLYEPLIMRLAQQNGLQEADARDVCQQVLATVAKDVEQWKPDGGPASFRRWLLKIARNRTIKSLFKERRGTAALGGNEATARLANMPDAQQSLSAEFEKEYRRQLLLLAAGQIRGEFRETTWAAFWQTSIEGRPAAEVAHDLKTSVGNVYVARSRIVARLRDKVAEREGSQE